MTDLFDKIPVRGEVWVHTKTQNKYVILGASFNAITDKLEVAYAPLYECDYSRFTRQMKGHAKAWVRPNEDGTPRYTKHCGETLTAIIDSLQTDELHWYRLRTGGI